MMKKGIILFVILLLFLTNGIWSLLGIIIAIIHVPYSVNYNTEYRAVIIRVKTTRALDMIPGYKNWRGVATGNIVVLNPKEEQGDLVHECIHVEQFMRYPGIFPLLNIIETYKNGYRNNRFELEAYDKAGNNYYP